jgi:hypothetical protein
VGAAGYASEADDESACTDEVEVVSVLDEDGLLETVEEVIDRRPAAADNKLSLVWPDAPETRRQWFPQVDRVGRWSTEPPGSAAVFEPLAVEGTELPNLPNLPCK